MTKKKMTEEDKRDWNELYTYVKSNIMGYDENQALSKNMVLRLKGLLTGKFIENKNISNNSNYSYKTILLTFKFCAPDIKRAFSYKSFKDESHKFNYALAIVEKNINNVYIRTKNAERVRKEIEEVDMSHTVEYTNTFKKKDKKINNKLDELW